MSGRPQRDVESSRDIRKKGWRRRRRRRERERKRRGWKIEGSIENRKHFFTLEEIKKLGRFEVSKTH